MTLLDLLDSRKWPLLARPIARIAPNTLLMASPEAWIHVNKKGYKRASCHFESARIEFQRDNIFSQSNTTLHDHRRKQLTHSYSGRDNHELESSVDMRIGEILSLLRRKYKIQFLTLDVVSTVGLGKGFGMLGADADIDLCLKSGEEGLIIGSMMMGLGLSWLVPAPVIGKLLVPSPGDGSGFGAMMAACYKTVDQRAETHKATNGRTDILTSWLRHGLTKDELRSEALEQIIAGSDTRAGALRGIMFYLMSTGRVYKKLQAEIDAMPYLQAVIREGMRVWPPVVNLFPHEVPAGGDTMLIDGKPVFLPGGSEIGLSGLAMMHNNDVFGEDAEDQDRLGLAVMLKPSELIWCHSKWQCLCKPIAFMEISNTIFKMLRTFDWALIDPTSPWKTKSPFGRFAIDDMWVRVTDR
ncbi:cytochrome P450 [Podospora didyma]|uniref:Cytochrome P450 n=1 Tax=Podospora didyma TaxID=330526 RepID=A0AAE0NGI9_9PEZI|nr:cytochrome P450 [Podospora didyma]